MIQQLLGEGYLAISGPLSMGSVWVVHFPYQLSCVSVGASCLSCYAYLQGIYASINSTPVTVVVPRRGRASCMFNVEQKWTPTH